MQVELDDLGRAGAHEEELPDVRPARQQPRDFAVELLVRVGEAGEVLLLEDRGPESGFGEDHHARGRLEQVRAGARAHHEEEGVLHLAVQPDDAGQAAEDLALAALLEDGCVAAAGGGEGGQIGSCRDPAFKPRHAELPEELGGVDDVGGVGRERDHHLFPSGSSAPVKSAHK